MAPFFMVNGHGSSKVGSVGRASLRRPAFMSLRRVAAYALPDLLVSAEPGQLCDTCPAICRIGCYPRVDSNEEEGTDAWI